MSELFNENVRMFTIKGAKLQNMRVMRAWIKDQEDLTTNLYFYQILPCDKMRHTLRRTLTNGEEISIQVSRQAIRMILQHIQARHTIK